MFSFLLFSFPQIALYLAKRDFVDNVDSVELVGGLCSGLKLSHTLDRSAFFKSSEMGLPFLYRRRC